MESVGKLVVSGRGGCLMLQRHPILENERTAQAGVPQCVQHEISHTRDTDVGVEAVLRVGTCTQYPYTTPYYICLKNRESPALRVALRVAPLFSNATPDARVPSD